MKIQVILAALLCGFLHFAQADDAINLDEVVVTAARIEQPLKQTLSSTSVITQEDIKNSQASDLPTILRSIAGVEISQNGGIGKASSLYLRGSNDTQVLVLIDGVRVNSATTGTTAIEHIMLDEVERIEVVRGNVSSLYGSEAIGGVVQIFTRHGAQAPAFSASAGAGSYGAYQTAAGLAGGSDNTKYSLHVSRHISGGYSSINPAIAPNANPDNDGYANTSVTASIRHVLNDDHALSASAFRSEGSSQFDAAFGSPSDTHDSDFRISKFSLNSDDRLNEAWASKLQLSQGTDYSRNFTNGLPATPGSLYQTTSHQLNWQNTFNMNPGKQMIAGAEYLNQEVSTDLQPRYDNNGRMVRSLFAGYTGNYDKQQVQLNVRHDRFSDFGVANTGLFGYGYRLTTAWRVTASTSTAFKAPTFNDMFYPFINYGGGYSYQGNPSLMPERSQNNELGMHYDADNQHADLVYFNNRIRDLITYNNQPAATMINLNEAIIDGFEASYSGKIDDTDLKIALTRQNPRDANTGENLLRRAKFFSSVGINRQLDAWNLGGEWRYSGERDDYDINTFSRTTLDSYHLLNLTARYRMNKNVEASMRLDNVFNQGYMLVHGYNTPGRSLFVSMSYRQ